MNQRPPVTPAVIIPNNVRLTPTARELSAARILADYFQTIVECVSCNNHKTPDFIINGITWELKTPTGTGKYNIQHALKHALDQSCNIVIDARFSKMHITKIKHELAYQARITRKIKQLLLIEKTGKIVVIK